MSRKHKKRRTSTQSRRRAGSSGKKSKSAVNYQEKYVTAHPGDLDATLTLAEQYLRTGREDKLLELVEPLEKEFPFDNAGYRNRYHRLLTLAYSHRSRFLDAERVLARGLAELPNSPDLWYAATYVYLSLRYFKKSVEAAEEYLQSVRYAHATGEASVPYSLSSQHQAQVLNMYAAACRDLGERTKAEAGFCAAVTIDPGNHLPYLNLANLLLHGGNASAAREVIEVGLRYCRQITELRLLQRSIEERPIVSACMIVKDEEELLPGCLDSIRDWVSEIIVVDTGSTDKTVEIAESYGARVFHQPWEGNFSKHRNYSLEQASGDWVFIIDADERLVPEDLPTLFAALSRPDNRIVSINVFNVYGREEETTTFLPSIRFFRRDMNLRYEGIVHNLLKLPDTARVVRTAVRLKHLGYDLSKEKMQKKLTRSRNLLEKQLAEDPDNAFALFNYAQLLRGEDEDNPAANAALIIRTAGHAVELTDPNNVKQRHIHIMCLNQLAWAHFYLGEYEQALKYADLALSVKPNYLDPLLLRGHIFVQANRHEEAETAYHDYLRVQAEYDASLETDNIIVAHIDARVNAHYALGMIGEIRKDREEAIRQYRETLALNPVYLEANARLGRVYLDEGDLGAAEQCFLRQRDSDMPSQEAELGLARIYVMTGREQQARDCYRRWLTDHPEDAQALMQYGRLCLEQGDNEQALALLNRAIAAGPLGRNDRIRLGGIFFQAGVYDKAAELYSALLDEQFEAALANDLANCYAKSGDTEQSLQWYRRAAEAPEAPIVAWRNLGLAYARAGELEKATNAMVRYLEEESEDMASLELLAGLYARQSEFEPAIDCFEKCLRLEPRSSSALVGISECYLAMGHRDSAVMGFRRALAIDPNCQQAKNRLAELKTISDRISP